MMGKWTYYVKNECLRCHGELSDKEVMYSGGQCKHCGHVSNGPMVNHYEIPCRKRRLSPWWRFWNIEIEIEENFINE